MISREGIDVNFPLMVDLDLRAARIGEEMANPILVQWHIQALGCLERLRFDWITQQDGGGPRSPDHREL